MSVPGVGRWLDILEITAQIMLVPPYFENLGKRPGRGRPPDLVVVHQPPRAGATTRALAPGVRALPGREFLDMIARSPAR